MRISNIVFVLGFLVLTQAATRATAISCCYVALKHVFTGVPANAGCLAPITFVIPDTTLLGVSALGQAGAAMGGAFLVWRRRRMAAKKSASV